MDHGTPFYRANQERLPLVTEGPPPDADSRVRVFVGTVRAIRAQGADRLLARVLRMDTRTVHDLLIDGLNYYAAVPARSLSARGMAALLREVPPERMFAAHVFNSDRKIRERMMVAVFSGEAARGTFVRRGNALLSPAENVYTFGDEASSLDGNLTVLANNVLCGHLYYLEAGGLEPGRRLTPRSFARSLECDAGALMSLNTFIAHLKREAAFDVETVVLEANVLPRLQCCAFREQYFARYRHMHLLHARLKESFKGVPIDPPPKNEIAMKLHEVTSVSLVLANKHLPKAEGAPRKTLLVFYNAGQAALPAERIDTSRLGVDYDAIKFRPHDTEYGLLLDFLRHLAEHVDVLYVYNADFDVTVLRQRIAFYQFRGRSPPASRAPCCAAHAEIPAAAGDTLALLWANFLSKQPDLYAGRVTLGIDLAHNNYTRFAEGARAVLSEQGNLAEKRFRVAALRARYQSDKSHMQNLKSVCYGSDLVDLRLVVTQKAYEDSSSGKLADKAELVIRRNRPAKLLAKCHKYKDVSYDLLDLYYRSGGTRLTECLVYNLVDSQLLVRMARYLDPVKEYVFRQVATYNVDQMVHTRGTMTFNGFIAPTKSVEVSRTKARMDIAAMTATGNLKNHMYTPETIARRGGHVLDPQTGLTFSTPGTSLENIVDYASLYPSIMCDLNISPDTIVDHGNERHVPDYCAYDWSTIDRGFSKYTLVLRVVREPGEPPRLERHTSDTCASLMRYLSERALHKRAMRGAGGQAFDYHNRLQVEMKVCANAHYGTSDLTCSLMITTQGQHKINLVVDNLSLMDAGDYAMFPNYGDTDSAMFFAPPDPLDVTEDAAPEAELLFGHAAGSAAREERAREVSLRLAGRVSDRFRRTQSTVGGFLSSFAHVLLDDAISRMTLLTDSGGGLGATKTSPRKVAGRWYFTDPATGCDMDATAAFERRMVTKLEYENCSSVTCHVAKKMYVCLVHEVSADGSLAQTAVKKRGMPGFKSSRFGATETIAGDFVNFIFKGHALMKRDDIAMFTSARWDEVAVSDVVMCLSEGGDAPTAHSVKDLCAVDRGLPKDMKAVCALLREVDPPHRETARTVLLHKGHSLEHLYSSLAACERSACFQLVSEYRTFSVSMGNVPWAHLLRHAKVSAVKNEYIAKLERYGVHVAKRVKTSYVNLVDRKTPLCAILGASGKTLAFPPEWTKQDPGMAMFRRFPIDLSLSTLVKDYFGNGFKCETPGFAPAGPFAEGAWRHVLQIKSHVDRAYFNDNAKCLVHVMVDALLRGADRAALGQASVTAEIVASVVSRVTARKAHFKRLIEDGNRLFYAVNNNVPPEMSANRDTFAYCPRSDRALAPLSAPLPEPSAFCCSYERMYRSARDGARAALASAREHVALEDAAECGNTTLTVLPKTLADDLGVLPQLRLVSGASDEPALIGLAQHLYFATLALHGMCGVDFEVHETRITSLVCPPARATGKELRSFFSRLAAFVKEHRERDPSAQLKAHCGGCLDYYSSITDDVIGATFEYDGRFFHLRHAGCLARAL